MRLSGIKSFKPRADFDWAWPAKIERDVMERALTLDFLQEGRNLVLGGTNGLGKTMIAQNIGHAAVMAGSSVLFRPRPPCWRNCIVKARKDAAANCAATPAWAACRSTRLAICLSTIRLPTDFMQSSIDATNAGSPPASCRRDRHRRGQLPRPGKPAGNGGSAEEEMIPAVPASDPASSVAAVLILDVELPETPLRARVQDQWQARRLDDRSVPLRVLESALLLASLRRQVRPPDGLPLSPIRSLAYFLPVIDELLSHPPPENYQEYLRLKLRRRAEEKSVSAEVPKKTSSDDR